MSANDPRLSAYARQQIAEQLAAAEQAEKKRASAIRQRIPDDAPRNLLIARKLNKTEMRFFREKLRDCHGLILAQAIVLPFGDGTSYRPDFVVITPGEPVRVIEIKGGHVGRVAWSRHGIERFRRARDRWGDILTFELWVYKKSDWHLM